MRNSINNTFLYYTPAIGWGILICYFSLLPQDHVPPLLQSIRDYVLHFLIYALLGLLSLFGSNRFSFKKINQQSMLVLFLVCSVLGLSLEIIQETLIDGRHFQWSDFVFNTLGVFLSVPINLFVFKKSL